METDVLDSIDLRELGRELQQARLKRGLTQDAAAKALGVARTTITAIEKGQRRVRPAELLRLADAYSREVADFVRARPPIAPFRVQFRGPHKRSAQDEASIAGAIHELEELVRDYLELEEIVDSPLVRKYPGEYSIGGQTTRQAAEAIALDERNRLGLGDGPLPILRNTLEQDVGIRVFFLPLKPSTFSAMYFYDHQAGASIAVNSLHPEERRRWSLAHEYLHFLVHRYESAVFFENVYDRVPQRERFADDFARYFLMPSGGLSRRVNDVRRSKQDLTVADLCTLAHYYGVSVAAVTLHLEDLSLVPTGTWDRLRSGGFKIRAAQKQLGLADVPANAELLPTRYQYLALSALDHELITEGQFARFLRVDRLEARRVAEALRRQPGEISDDELSSLDLAEHLI